jgi:3'-phosphoadenosine 5'-phosphosulfate sulfotransferase (PAPS reductase)/FAD synthetase
MKIIVSFSGGKDSQACLIQAVKKYGADKIEAVFCDTGWEHPVTYTHIENVCIQLAVKLTIIRNDKVRNFQEMCRRMKCFPVASRRACTAMLKIQPMIDWIIGQNEHFIIIQGIRAKESKARETMTPECSYFKEYFEIETGKKIYRKRAVINWCKTHDASVLRPIFYWTAQEVIDYIIENGQRPNPLYSQGASRVGCFPCIMSRKGEIKVLSKDEPMKQRLISLEKEVDSLGQKSHAGFFPKGYIPDRFCREYGDGCPTVTEVINYVNRNDAGMKDMFEPEGGYSCMSLYHGLCE